MATIRVMVVEDFAPFRRFLAKALEKNRDLQVVFEASDGQEAVRKAQEVQPDLILLDIGLPSLNGIAAARQMRSVAPNSKIIFVTQESSPDVVQAGLETGAMGYILKTRAESDLLIGIAEVLQGRQFVSEGLTAARLI